MTCAVDASKRKKCNDAGRLLPVVKGAGHARPHMNPGQALLCLLCRFKQAQEGEAIPPEEVESRLARIPRDVWGKLYRCNTVSGKR